MTAPTGAPSIFPHYRSSACSRRSSLYFSTAAAVTAPAGALPVFPHCRSSDCSPQERYLYFPTATAVSAPAGALSVFPTAAAVLAPAGTFSIFPHCRSSACSSRNLLYISHCPSGDCSRRSTICFSHYRSSVRSRRSSLHFSHCRSSACSRRSFLYVSPLPQQCLLPQERYLYFLTAAVVTAPPGALPVFPHCRSSVCSRRSAIYISPLPQQCPLPQEPSQYFPIAAAVPAPAGAPSISPHCRSSVCSRRSAIYISPLPQQCPLPQEPFRTSPLPQQCLLPQELHQYLPTAAAVSTLTSSFLSPRCHSSTLQQKPLLPPRCRSIITSGVQHPISPKAMQFLGGLLATIWLLSHDKHFLGSFWVRAKCRARTPLPGRGEYPGLGNDYRARSPLLGQHAKYAYRLFSSLLCKCELVKWCFINKFREEHARIINTANSSSVITSLIQWTLERTPINNQAALPPLSLVFQNPSTTPTPHFQSVSTPAGGRGELLGPGQMPSSDPSPWARGVPRARERLPSSEPSPRTARQIRIPFIQFIIM